MANFNPAIDRMSFQDCMHNLAQGAINIDNGLTTIEEGSRVHRAMHDLCFHMTEAESNPCIEEVNDRIVICATISTSSDLLEFIHKLQREVHPPHSQPA